MKKLFLFLLFTLILGFVIHAQEKVNAKDFPFVLVTKLVMKTENSNYVGTGVILDRNHILTNAHNVKGKDSILIYPGYAPYDNAPFRVIKVKCIRNKTIFYSDNFEKEKDLYDFAIIKYKNDDVYDKVMRQTENQTFSIDDFKNNEIDVLNISGYPVHKFYEFKKNRGKLQYHNSTTKYSLQNNVLINYRMNTRKGNSGSPLWINKNGELIIIGIHKSGKGYSNQGLLYDAFRIELIKSWLNK